MMFSIMRSRSDNLRSTVPSLSGFVDAPNSLRRKFITALVKRSNAVNASPFDTILANLVRNSGLLIASDTNSSKFVAPYAVSNLSFTDSNNLVSCLVTGCDLLANVAETAAWVISCSTVCTFIPASASRRIVLVLGSKLPASSRFSTTSIFVVPTTSASLVTALRT